METQKTIVLSGASRGIGHATVKRFSAAGWRVLTLSRQPFDKACPWPDGAENHVQVDLADADSLGMAVADIRARLDATGGELAALVNNAGISPKGPDGARLAATDTDVDAFRRVEMVNLVAPLIPVRELLDPLVRARGSIVNVSSIAATQVHPFAGAAYAVSKAGLSALTRELAHELAPRGVRANVVSPGEIETAILSPGTDAVVERDVPMGRMGHPREVADVVVFLASPGASYINGAEIPINGGQHLA